MKTTEILPIALLLGALAAGCDRTPVTNSPAVTVPPADAALAAPKTGGEASTGSSLSTEQRNTQMPMTGQANDHSVPEASKRGTPAKPAK